MSLSGLILAAGEAKRFRPLVTAKPLIPVCGQTLLGGVAANLQAIGIKKLVVVVRPQDEPTVKSLLAKAKLAVQAKPTGMAGAILAAKKLLSGPTVIVNAADLIDRQIFQQFRRTVKTQPQRLILTGYQVKNYLPGGYLQLKNDQVTGIIEKPAPNKLPSRYLTIVLHFFPDIGQLVKRLGLTPSSSDDVYEQTLNQWLKLEPAVLVKARGYFQPLKYPWQLLDLTQTVLNYRLKPTVAKTAQIHPTAVIDGPVRIGAGSQIMAYSVIKGPSFIGKNVIIGDHVLVRQSTIEAGSVVGFGSEIVRSYVGPNNNFHANFVGDSIIEAESNLGSGAVLANLRFDKKPVNFKRGEEKIPTARIKFGAVVAKGAQIGVNASVMPGASLESGEVVFSGPVKA